MQQKSASRSNRRRERRLLPKSWTKIACRKGRLDLGENIAQSALDVAETGARLVVRQKLQENEEVALSLATPGQLRPLRVLGKVIWCVETADHNFCVGVQFHERLSHADLIRMA